LHILLTTLLISLLAGLLAGLLVVLLAGLLVVLLSILLSILLIGLLILWFNVVFLNIDHHIIFLLFKLIDIFLFKFISCVYELAIQLLSGILDFHFDLFQLHVEFIELLLNETVFLIFFVN